MYVTDTPVIDRMLNPGPMEVLERVAENMRDWSYNAGEHLQLEIDERVLPLAKELPPDLRDRLFDITGDLCAAEMDRQLALVLRFTDELATRLAAIQ